MFIKPMKVGHRFLFDNFYHWRLQLLYNHQYSNGENSIMLTIIVAINLLLTIVLVTKIVKHNTETL